MRNIAFVVPLIADLGKYLLVRAGKQYQETTEATSIFLLAIWVFVGWLLYEGRG